MKTIFTIFFCVLFTLTLQSQTTISAGNVSGVWTKAASPYIIQGEITVAKGTVLTLEPGTVLEFQGNFGLTVKGVLNSIGKKGDSIVYKAGAGLVWAGISYVRNFEVDTIVFNYCRFENVGEGFHNGFFNSGIASLNSSPLVVKNTSFYFFYTNKQQNISIYTRRNSCKIDSIYIFSSATTSVQRGSIDIDSTTGFWISNINFNILNLKINISGIAVSNSVLGYLKNIKNSPNTFGRLGFINCRNMEILDIEMDGYVSVGFRDLRNSKFKNINIKNSRNGAFQTFGNCTGTVIENCLVENCGDFNSNPLIPSLNLSSTGPLFYNCKFLDNKFGVSINQKNGSGSPFFLNCLFDRFKSRALGIEGYPVLINCNITRNSDLQHFYFKNVPVRQDNAPYFGGVSVVREFDNSRPYFYNCLLWGNRDSFGNSNSVVLIDKVVKADFNHCVIQGDSSKGIVGADGDDYSIFQLTSNQLTYLNSSGTSPNFVDSSIGNYQLTNNCNQQSQIINKGMRGNLLSQYPYNTLLSVYGINIYHSQDLAGNPRVTDDTLDIGCYESAGNKRNLKLLSSFSDTTLCYGGNNTYSSKTSGAVQQYQWQQKQNNAISTIANTRILSLSNIKQNGYQYRLQVINNECLPLKDSSAWFSVSVNSPVKKGITQNKDTLYQKDTVEFSTVSQNYTQIKWSTGATSPILKLKGSSFNTLGKHAISVEAIKNTGCTETDTAYVYIKANSSIHSKQAIYGIKIYPSPSQSQLTIEGKGVIEILMYTTDGKLIQTNQVSKEHETIDISSLSQGLYIITLRLSTGEIHSMRVVKE